MLEVGLGGRSDATNIVEPGLIIILQSPPLRSIQRAAPRGRRPEAIALEKARHHQERDFRRRIRPLPAWSTGLRGARLRGTPSRTIRARRRGTLLHLTTPRGRDPLLVLASSRGYQAARRCCRGAAARTVLRRGSGGAGGGRFRARWPAPSISCTPATTERRWLMVHITPLCVALTGYIQLRVAVAGSDCIWRDGAEASAARSAAARVLSARSSSDRARIASRRAQHLAAVARSGRASHRSGKEMPGRRRSAPRGRRTPPHRRGRRITDPGGSRAETASASGRRLWARRGPVRVA